ncbi:transglycosylase domain-containing protein [Dongia sp.]|uniref:transglycosylase domain-containing protein n=1 Tax=Dongia sp. TaxID=1977262 RepID=UPI0035B2D00D
MSAGDSRENEEKKGKTGRSWRRRLALFTLKWGFVGGIWAGFLGLIFVAWCAYDLPDVSKLNEIKRRSSVSLVAGDGSLIASYGDLYGSAVALKDLPAYLPQAVIATEDRRFYSHFGLDLRGLLRAFYVNFTQGRLVQGGSSITQQLAKNIFLTPERSIHRKGQEVLLALWLEQNFTKDQILELYLNRVYFGAGTYGVDAASRKYFGHPATEATLFESAMLAGMLKAPSRYNPLNDKKLARDRATLVLQNMVVAEYIAPDVADAAATMTAPSVSAEARGQIGQFFADWVLDQVSSYVGYTEQDLVVETTLDPKAQRLAEADLAKTIAELGPKQNASQAALVSMTPGGAVKAMVGGVSYRDSQFNRATQALRQPGSAFKAFVFLAAFEAGYGPGSIFNDTPIRIGKWQPGNYNDKFYGEVNLREAFARSLNSVAVQLSEQVGRKNVIAAAQRLGITSPIGNDASIALGTSETTLLEMTTAYAVFANQGKGVWPYAIERITTRDGQLLYERGGSGPGRVASGSAVNAMLDVMASVVDWGTGKKAKLEGWPVYGKTGTSQNFRDAWFVGLTADLVTGVWVGNDNGAPMDKVTGGSLPVVIWHDFMSGALADLPPRDVPRGGGALVASAGAPTELTPEVAQPPAAPEKQPEESGIGALLDTILGNGGGSGSEKNAAPAKPQKEKKPAYQLREDEGRD